MLLYTASPINTPTKLYSFKRLDGFLLLKKVCIYWLDLIRKSKESNPSSWMLFVMGSCINLYSTLHFYFHQMIQSRHHHYAPPQRTSNICNWVIICNTHWMKLRYRQDKDFELPWMAVVNKHSIIRFENLSDQ